MRASVEPIPAAPTIARSRSIDFLELTKPRITLLVLATTLVGFYLGAHAAIPPILLLHTLLGTGLVAGGASAWNMWMERNLDSRMQRTLHRPLPAGRLQPGEALLFALLISVIGLIYLYSLVNPLSSLLSAITLLSYLFLYTPLKTRTWLCTMIGALPGAVPPMIGWAAATGALAMEAWTLFAIVFLWQLPHFYAIAWLYREDYERAGFPMLPVIDATGMRTGRHVTFFILLLLLASLSPGLLGFAGALYLSGAVLLGFAFMGFGIVFGRLRDSGSARRLFIVSVCYLPILLTLLVLDEATP